MLAPVERPKLERCVATILQENLMDRGNVYLRVGRRILQADPVTTVVAPRLIDDCGQSVELEDNSIILEPDSPHVGDARNGLEQSQQRPKDHPTARDLKPVEPAIVSVERECLQGR